LQEKKSLKKNHAGVLFDQAHMVEPLGEKKLAEREVEKAKGEKTLMGEKNQCGSSNSPETSHLGEWDVFQGGDGGRGKKNGVGRGYRRGEGGKRLSHKGKKRKEAISQVELKYKASETVLRDRGGGGIQ